MNQTESLKYTKEFLSGNEILARGALGAGATFMSAYPITPSTEIMEYWVKAVSKDKNLKFLQAEDEMSAGFAMIGAVLTGTKAFTATAGPGNILMQDAFSMAEALRIPTVAFIMQRGGPSTGTVIYSQQELNLTCFGGNGEGLRVVYSPSDLQELYDYSIKSFNSAWRYFFPTFLLADGYLGKMIGEVKIYKPKNLSESFAFFQTNKRQPTTYINLKNTFELEEDLYEKLQEQKEIFDQHSQEIAEYEKYKTEGAEAIIFAHGSVAQACKKAVDALETQNVKVGLFRPITLQPFPTGPAREAALSTPRIFLFESSLGQFMRLLESNLYGIDTPITETLRPAKGFTPEEIVTEVIKGLSGIKR